MSPKIKKISKEEFEKKAKQYVEKNSKNDFFNTENKNK